MELSKSFLLTVMDYTYDTDNRIANPRARKELMHSSAPHADAGRGAGRGVPAKSVEHKLCTMRSNTVTVPYFN